MLLRSSSEIKAKITELDAAIVKAQTAQSYSAGAGMSVSRDLRSMYAERERLEKEYYKAVNYENGGVGGNLAEINRPR